MLTIIIGTNRSGSYSRRLANVYCEMLTEIGVTHQVIHLKNLPAEFMLSSTYDSATDEKFIEIQKMIDSSDRFLFIVPEYNGSFPGVLKAFIDRLEFPNSFKGNIGAMAGISSGTQGSALAMSHLTDILHYLGMIVMPIKPRITAVEKQFEDRKLINPFIHDLIRMQVEQLLRVKGE